MLQLDPEREYVLLGNRRFEKAEASPPRIMLIRLSASLLETLVSAGVEENRRPKVSFTEGEDVSITVGSDVHHLQHTYESSPHQLYTSSEGQSKLKLVGSIDSKLHLRQEGNGGSSTSAATRLKERKELEEARKAEHRTVLIDAPLLGQNKSKGAKLKLRPKGLAPSATNSPLIRSRAGTPEVGSVPGSPTFPSNHLSAKTPPTQSPALPSMHSNPPKPSPLGGSDTHRPASPPTLRRRMMQILAKGPLPRRNIVQELNRPEPEVLPLLDQIAEIAPKHLQPAKDRTKKYSGPVNQRSSTQSNLTMSVNGKGESGPGTVYILKDALYSEILIEEWTGYSHEEMRVVSEHAKEAFTRLKLDANAEEWKKLFTDGQGMPSNQKIGSTATRQSSRGNSRAAETSSSLSDLLDDSSSKQITRSSSDSVRSAPKKDSVFSRINKASKGKASAALKSKSGTATNSKAANRSKGQDVEMQDGTETATGSKNLPSSERLSSVIGSSKEASKRVVKAGQRSLDLVKTSNRKDIEYTDSSSDDIDEKKMHKDANMDDKKKRITLTRPAKSSSEASENLRQRRGVGSGAAFHSEPWLDVRNHGDWKRLAERFQRVYIEYTKGKSRLQEEESMIKAELELARLEKALLERGEARVAASSLHSDNDLEEGEASPTNASHAIKTEADPIVYHNVKWRHHADQKAERLQVSPLSIDELALQICQIQEMEAQLHRMKGTLKSSKKNLEVVAT